MEKYLRKMNMRGITHLSVPLPIYSSTHPPIYSFIHSSTHSFIHPSPTHSFIHPPFNHSLIRPPLTHSFICLPLSHAFIHSSIYTSIHSSVHPSIYPPTIHQVPTVLWATPGTSIKDHTKPRSRGLEWWVWGTWKGCAKRTCADGALTGPWGKGEQEKGCESPYPAGGLAVLVLRGERTEGGHAQRDW